MASGYLGCSKNVRKRGVKCVHYLRAELCANRSGLRHAMHLAVLINIFLKYLFICLFNP